MANKLNSTRASSLKSVIGVGNSNTETHTHTSYTQQNHKRQENNGHKLTITVECHTIANIHPQPSYVSCEAVI